MFNDLGCRTESSVWSSVAAPSGPGALPSLFCLFLGFFGGVGPMVPDLFFPFLAGVVGGCCPLDDAAASAYDFGCCLCTMLTWGVFFAVDAATLVERSLVLLERL